MDREKAKNVMMQGCASSVGKSLLTAALCRIIRQDGYSVAPFKSQNMALNSFITKEGHEMGRAQVVQAEAAGIEPDVRMNPILLKPTSDKKSQVIVNGEVYANKDFKEYHKMKPSLRGKVMKAYASLAGEYEYMVLEGAGSPAEINLSDADLVNMGMAKMADAPVILIGDIDKGGVFAFIAGTLLLMPEEDRRRVKGVIINKFRGDKEVLAPGLTMLEELINLPVLGVVPHMNVDIEDEDSVSDRFKQVVNQGQVEVAVIKLPHLSNYTDFNAFSLEPSVRLRYVERADELGDPDLIILPGTKNTIEDMLFLKSVGFDRLITTHAREGKALIGICGGYQMLANSLRDPNHIESSVGTLSGLGLVDMEVNFQSEKVTTQVTGLISELGQGILRGLGGTEIGGYEIHMGDNTFSSEVIVASELTERNGEICRTVDGAVNQAGNVFGTYVHGIFDQGGILRGILNNILKDKGYAEDDSQVLSYQEYKEIEYDRLADIVRNSLDMEKVYDIMEGRA